MTTPQLTPAQLSALALCVAIACDGALEPKSASQREYVKAQAEAAIEALKRAGAAK